MKFFYLFLIVTFFCCESFAAKENNFGIFRSLISESAEEIESRESSISKVKFDNSLVLSVFANDEYQSSNRKDEFLDTRLRGRLNSYLSLSNHFLLSGFLRMDTMNQSLETARRNALSSGGGDRSFENEGVFAEELNFAYNGKKHAFVVGKFDLNFGTAWRFNRGIWTYSIADNYRQKEKLGLGGVYRMGVSKKTGRYEFSYAFFTNDRKNLDNSVITGRDSTHKSDGVPGDSRSILQSYVAALDIDFDFAEKEKLNYHFSYLNLAVNERSSSIAPAKISDQKNWAAGINYKYPVAENLLLDALAEYAVVKNLGGNIDASEKYLTTNVIARFNQNWNLTLGYAKQHNAVVETSSYDKNLSEISVGYEFLKTAFFDRLLFQVGYKNQRDNYKTSLESRNSFGGFVRYQKNF